MNFPALCANLERRIGIAPVYDGRHPGLGARDAETAELVLVAREGSFAVGGVDRGRFVPVHEFDSEGGACDYMLQVLTSSRQLRPETADQRNRSAAVTDAVTDALLQEFNAKHR